MPGGHRGRTAQFRHTPKSTRTGRVGSRDPWERSAAKTRSKSSGSGGANPVSAIISSPETSLRTPPDAAWSSSPRGESMHRQESHEFDRPSPASMLPPSCPERGVPWQPESATAARPVPRQPGHTGSLLLAAASRWQPACGQASQTPGDTIPAMRSKTAVITRLANIASPDRACRDGGSSTEPPRPIEY